MDIIMSYTDEQIDQIRATLNAAGDDWQTVAATLPQVRAYDDEHGGALAVIELDAPRESNERIGITDPYAILYRSEPDFYHEPEWFVVGWSNAGRSRPGRSIGADGVYMWNPVILKPSPADTTREKLAGLAGMFEAAAANPDLDEGFPADVYRYLHGDDEEPEA